MMGRRDGRSAGRVAALLAGAVCALCAIALAQSERADALFETAMAAHRMNRFEDSAQKLYDFMAEFPTDPRNAEAQYYVGRAYVGRNFLNKAIEEFGYTIEDFPDSPFAMLALHDRAQAYLQTRRQEEAIEHMERLIATDLAPYQGAAQLHQINVNHRSDVFWLARFYLDGQRYEDAIAAYRRLPDEMEAFRLVVDVYYSLNDYDTIRELIDGLTEKNRHEGFKYLIEFYAKRKAYNQVKGIFSKLLEEKDPDAATDDLVWTTAWNFQHFGPEHLDWAQRQISAHYPRLARRADYELARRHWQEASYLDELELYVIKYRTGSDVDAVLRWKGIMLERGGQPEEARKTYRRISNPAMGHWFVAGTYDGPYARAKDYQAAINEYVEIRKAFYSLEWSAMAQWRVAEIHRSLRQVDKAVEAFRQIVARFGSLSAAGTRVGSSGDVYIDMPRRDYGPEAQLALSDVLREAERYDEAILEYRTLVRDYPKTVQATVGAYRTALCYEGKEDPETAVKVLKSVLRRFPKSAAASDAHTRLETVYNVPDVEVSDVIDFFGDVQQ